MQTVESMCTSLIIPVLVFRGKCQRWKVKKRSFEKADRKRKSNIWWLEFLKKRTNKLQTHNNKKYNNTKHS